LYLGGVNGFTRIEKNSTFTYDVVQKARIKCIELLNDRNEKIRYYDFSKISHIPSNVVQIRAYGSVHDYTKAHKLHSEYRINKGPWIKTEYGHQMIVNNPSMGEFNLEFRYKSFGDIVPSNAVEFTTYIEPKWYESTWFRLSLALLIAANAIWITRLYFRRQLLAKQKELEKQQALQSQRDRISIDMHDDLGSGLSSIKMISEMLKRKHQDEETKTDLNQIVDEASELTATMRDLVWSLNPRNDTILGFADHARRFVKQYFERADIEVHFQLNIEENDLAMHGLARRNLLMILKETCTNIYKYAHTRKVDFCLMFQGTKLIIQIQDHGTGLPENASENNGFYSMRKRVQEIGGTIHWYSDINGLNTVVEWTLA
jgi:signal transduction histidine kinase